MTSTLNLKDSIQTIKNDIVELQNKKNDIANLKTNYSEFVFKSNENKKVFDDKLLILETKINEISNNLLRFMTKLDNIEKELMIN